MKRKSIPFVQQTLSLTTPFKSILLNRKSQLSWLLFSLFITLFHLTLTFQYIICELLFCNFSADALQKNQDLEFERNKERFMFLKVCCDYM